MDMLNSALNLFVPPASLVMLAFSWPALCFINTCEKLYNTFFIQDMEDKVVIVTGASSGIGEQIAYEYAKKRANLVLIARREFRLRGISENARRLGARNVLIMGADVVKEDDCRRFVNETVNYFGRVDHLVNTASLGHTFYFEEANDASVFPILMDVNFWGNVYPTYVALPYLRQNNGRIIVNASVENWLPLPRMSLYSADIKSSGHVIVTTDATNIYLYPVLPDIGQMWAQHGAAKAALVNFYETLRLEVKEEVGVTIATHGWIGAEITGGKLMLEEGAEMQWKEEREVHASGGPVEKFARLIVAGACRGDPYVKYPSWYDIFLLYRVFAPNVLNWTFRLLFANNGSRRTSFIGTGRPLLEAPSPKKLITGPPLTFAGSPVHQQQKME